MGIGGLPCGRISELFGPDSSGKQALAAHLIAQCQRQDGVAAYIDVNHRLDPEQMKVIGVDFDSLLVARPGDAAQAMEIAIRLARGGGIRMIVFDEFGGGPSSPDPFSPWGEGEIKLSVNSSSGTPRTPPERGLTAPSGLPRVDRLRPPGPPLRLRALSASLLRRLVSAVDKNGVAFVFMTNAPASASGARSSPKGGQALRFFASVRLEMERAEWIRRGREVVGCQTVVRVAKNKLAPPLKEVDVELLFYRFPPSMPALQLRQPAQKVTSALSENQVDRVSLVS